MGRAVVRLTVGGTTIEQERESGSLVNEYMAAVAIADAICGFDSMNPPSFHGNALASMVIKKLTQKMFPYGLKELNKEAR